MTGAVFSVEPFKLDGQTVGVELEWADVDRSSEIDPAVGRWNEQDYSIVNSDGTANCPRGVWCQRGGEINTVPTGTAQEQADIVRVLAEQLRPVVNYKCNLHVHVRPDLDLLSDLGLLKRTAAWARVQEGFVFHHVDPIEPPNRADYSDDEWFRGAVRRYRRNLTSHHRSVPDARWAEMMGAATVSEFKDAHAPLTVTGRRAFHVTPRAGINLRSLWKHGTVEYRHFFGTADPDEVRDAVEWCHRFTFMATRQLGSAAELHASRPWRFPRARPYDHNLQLGFERTSKERTA